MKTSARNVRRRVTTQKAANNGAAQENVRNVQTRTITTATGVNVALPNIANQRERFLPYSKSFIF